MPGPFSWDPTKPGDTDYRNVYPALARGDKTTLANILGTLAPSGAPTCGFRVVQQGNLIILAQNAAYQPGSNQWLLDDVSIPANALIYSATDNTMTFGWSPAGTSPFTNWLAMTGFNSPPATVNQFILAGAATGNAPGIEVVGADPNIGLSLWTKGQGMLTLNGKALGAASLAATGYVRLGPVTLQWGLTNITTTVANTWASVAVTFPVAFSANAYIIIPIIVGGADPVQEASYQNLTATGVSILGLTGTPRTVLTAWLTVGPS
jgi:hypothetical protein